ncbi:MAG TPA: sigma 54-interacting transcriptional regulator [Thermodesulfobacteriota bacterium]|nr:sigma 54-interacting transcriptional regulator [Thermodesulfobacteriota bacterium]
MTPYDAEVADGFIVTGPPLAQVVEKGRAAAPYDTPILIEGEAGTGKEALARHLHAAGGRAAGPFQVYPCDAPATELREAIEAALGGTLYLDAIDALPLPAQPPLLRTLERLLPRPGRRAPLRIMAASTTDLREASREGRFRHDLYYRLAVVRLRIPPLRQRPGDLAALLDAQLARVNATYGLTRRFAPELREALLAYPWPGNVRELVNVVEAMALTARHDELSLADLPDDLGVLHRPGAAAAGDLLEGSGSMAEALAAFEKALIARALRVKGSTHQAAKVLKLDQSTVYRKAKKYRLLD